ncbi:hypothetical protein MMYC01_202156 [Madurella mycetomatis]|uniref:Tyrosinase copper-binding domain-containing protein n=1 Tax=Madurella mycetomatis TaxID=100816 RepID=A0A175WDM5_9PEZI|nr:hypothetical protein MMYC01_202156 [Madurella mycetomatis]
MPPISRQTAVDALRLSPVFDGSDTSLWSDGAFVPGRNDSVLVFPGFGKPVVIPLGTGGGCVEKGPFSDLVVRLGPFKIPEDRPLLVNPVDGREENLRCLVRDPNVYPLRRWSSFKNSADLIKGRGNIRDFHGALEGDPRVTAAASIGGTAQGSIISSSDPAFWLTHAQLDRWKQGVHGTGTYLNIPPSAEVKVEDVIDVLPHAGPVKIKDLMNTVGGNPLCYAYLS